MKIFNSVNFINNFKKTYFKKETINSVSRKPENNYVDYFNSIGNINKSLIHFSRKLKLNKMQVLELLDQGKSEEEIAKITDCSPKTVHEYLLSWGVKTKRSILDKNKDQIIELTASGKSTAEIAEILGCSVTVINKAKNKLGISSKSKAAKNREEIIRLYSEGKSQQEIADIMGVHQTSIGKALSRWGCKTTVKYAEDNKEEIIRLYGEGKGLQEIADIIGVCPLTIRNNLIKWGVELRNPNNIEASKEEVIKLFNQGKSYREIADIVGTNNYYSIKMALIRWGVIEDDTKPRTLNRPELNKDTIIKLYNEGKTQMEIAQITGCTQPGISKALKLWGVKPNSGKVNPINITEKYKKLIIELYKRGKNLSEIGSIIGCHYTTVGFALRNWGIESNNILNENNIEKVIKLKEAGKTTKEIASILRCSCSSIDRIIRLLKKQAENED